MYCVRNNVDPISKLSKILPLKLLYCNALLQYLGRFDVIPVFQSEEEMEHWIMPRQDIVSSYVVEVRKGGRERVDLESIV